VEGELGRRVVWVGRRKTSTLNGVRSANKVVADGESIKRTRE
jgi:hypothetical protein